MGKLQRHTNKPRPVLITMPTLEHKYRILKETKNLKGKEAFNNIRIQQDLTRSQRQTRKELVDEAKRLEQEDQSRNFIFRVRGPPEKMEVRKIKKTQATGSRPSEQQTGIGEGSQT